MDIRKLPPQEIRIETGPTQFGEDWPGVFIRGDDSAGYYLLLSEGIRHLPEDEAILKAQLEGLLALFNSSNLMTRDL